MPREVNLAHAFVELADTLVADFDVVDFLHVLASRCVELLGVQAAGLMLADQRGQLRLVASSSEQSRLLELFELEIEEGPCLTCFETGQPTNPIRGGPSLVVEPPELVSSRCVRCR